MTTVLYAGTIDGARDAGKAVSSAIDTLIYIKDQVASFRQQIEAGQTSAGNLRSFYDNLSSRRSLLGRLAAVPGFAERYVEALPNAPQGFSPITAYGAVDGLGPALTTLLDTLWAGMDKSAAGHAAMLARDPVTLLLIDYAIPVAGATQTAVLAQLDQVTACIG